ncbi:MAG TPA: hypothetical protein ENK55_06910 [Actinobacteria bacterium]|nr:hypothetical protein [Actinomycetota bacterium]
MSKTAYRIVMTVLGLVFVLIVVGTVLVLPEGDPARYPDAVVGFSPADGDLVFRGARIEFRTDPAYRASFVIDGIPIPDAEVVVVEGTGLHIYEPGPGKTIEAWTPGFHVVEARWDRTSGLPDPGSLTWSFRVR